MTDTIEAGTRKRSGAGLEGMLLPELKQLGSSLGLKGTGAMRKGALIEGGFSGLGADDLAPQNAIVSVVDGIAMVTREPIDRLQQIIAQSWYWIGGFCAPSDTTTTPSTVSTATNAAFKRAVMIEHFG